MLPKSRLHALSVCLSARLPGRQRATKRVWGGWHEHSPTGRGTGAGSVNGASCRCDADRAGVRVCVKWVLHRERGGRPRWWVGRERALGENLSLISRLGGANVACCVCERESRDWCGACASATRCMCISGILFTRTDHLYVICVHAKPLCGASGLPSHGRAGASRLTGSRRGDATRHTRHGPRAGHTARRGVPATRPPTGDATHIRVYRDERAETRVTHESGVTSLTERRRQTASTARPTPYTFHVTRHFTCDRHISCDLMRTCSPAAVKTFDSDLWPESGTGLSCHLRVIGTSVRPPTT